jgi:hypothetical protein
MQDLISIYKGLARPEHSSGIESFTTVTLEGSSHRMGKDSDGNPTLLVCTSTGSSGSPIHLEHLDVRHSIRCRVFNSGKEEEGIFTIIRCTGASEELAAYFLRSVEPVLRTLTLSPTSQEVMSAIQHLVELFRALAQPPIKSVSGLWAELFFIYHSKDPLLLMSSWHTTPEDKYDFNNGIQRIEIKSTSQRSRVHHFALEQLTPPEGCDVAIVSIFSVRSGGGLSLGDLADEVHNLLISNPELQERLDRVMASTLGNTLHRSLSERFDQELARESIKVYQGAKVPRITERLPWGVSEVHFKSDLSNSEELGEEVLAAAGSIFAAI